MVIPETEWTRVVELADKKDVTALTVLKQFIKLGFLAEKALKNGGSIIIREGDKEREIILT